MSYVNLLDIIYPVGSIYRTSSDISPSASIGGTWEKVSSADTPVANSYQIKAEKDGKWHIHIIQVGELVNVNFFTQGRKLAPWESIKLASNIPKAKSTNSEFSYEGIAIYQDQPTSYGRLYIDNDSELWITNKSGTTSGEWWAGMLTYPSSQVPVNNNNPVYMWKRLS